MTGIIILAAGASNRFGSPKQNQIYQGKTLLQRAIQTALTCLHCEKVIVVLGANEQLIRPNIPLSLNNIKRRTGSYKMVMHDHYNNSHINI